VYSTCLFCHHDLGSNEVVEHFPIGRRLAFDGEKGRLWVVCRSCERWNLTPIEERWEAIEECERLFRDTKLRMSTEHIGLARVSEGLELVRVGDPQRPEMAAWRYGDQFGKRRRRYYMLAAGGLATAGALASGYAALGLFAGGGATLLNVGVQSFSYIHTRRVVARVPTPGGTVDITRAQLPRAKIISGGTFGWKLSIEHKAPPAVKGATKLWERLPQRLGGPVHGVDLEPSDALPALGVLLPLINGRGGSKRRVQTAVELIQEGANASKILGAAASIGSKRWNVSAWDTPGRGRLASIPLEARLALEMLTHEDDERRALEGELATLEERWKEAEEIANISDNMFLPTSVTEWIHKIRS
jgi:hypothetical protein